MTNYIQRRRVGEHRIVYERERGPIPEGFHVHHRNEKIRDNAPDNLEALSPGDHKKTHSKRYIRRPDGGWNKICHTCGVQKSIDEFYSCNWQTTHRRDCKQCYNEIEKARRLQRDPEITKQLRRLQFKLEGRT